VPTKEETNSEICNKYTNEEESSFFLSGESCHFFVGQTTAIASFNLFV